MCVKLNRGAVNEKIGTPLEIKVSISNWKWICSSIKTPYPNLGPDWGSKVVDAEGKSGESQMCQSNRKTKTIYLHLPLYVQNKHTHFVAMTIFFYSLLRFSYNLMPCPCLHHVFWREGHKESNERYIYFFTFTNVWRKSLFLPTASFFTVYSSGGVTLRILKLWTVLQPLYFFCTSRKQGVLGEWLPTAESPLSVTQIFVSVIYPSQISQNIAH